MKYLAYWEFDLENREKAFEMQAKAATARKEKPDDFPDTVLGAHNIAGSSKGLTIFETDDPEKLLQVSLRFSPVVRWKFLPLYPIGTIRELIKEIKQ